MGICPCIGVSDVTTREINRQMEQGRLANDDLIKLLFLGAGGSGKSTLFKQLRLLHGDGLGPEERKNNTHLIYQNLLDGMSTLVDGNVYLHELHSADDEKNPSGVAKVTQLCNEELADYIGDLTSSDKITAEIAKYFKQAWSDPGIKQTWENRSKLQVQDSLQYFMEHIDRIAEQDYVPSKDDVLHVRNRTTGIIEQKLKIKDRPFLIVDVGGQRSERRKWANCFADVTGLIFVASLAAYNQLLYEDEATNRMAESLKTFEDIMKTSAFNKCCVILFLNKSDLFSEKIDKWPITSCFENYTGPLTEHDQYDYIKRAFESKNTLKSRKVHVHRTQATDTSHIKGIFKAVNQKIIDEALIRAGLIVG